MSSQIRTRVYFSEISFWWTQKMMAIMTYSDFGSDTDRQKCGGNESDNLFMFLSNGIV